MRGDASFPATLSVGGSPVPLLVRRSSRARRLTLRACGPSRSIRLTLPSRMPAAMALRFLADQGGWLEAQVAARFAAPAPFLPGGLLRLADEDFALVVAPVRRVVRADPQLLVPADDPERFNAAVVGFVQRQARRLLSVEAREMARGIGREVAALRIGDPRSRWGSCSAGGRLAFSWRLVLAPGFVRRSVVAHEVAHLVHMDHGAEFHRLADALSGGAHDRARAWLRANAHQLHRQGRFD